MTTLGVVALILLAGCAPNLSAAKPTPTASAARSVVFRVPAASPTDLLRLVYQKPADAQETSVTVPANATGFSMGAACESVHAHSKIGWVVTPQAGGASISSAKIPCDGATYLESAIVPGSSQAVHVTLTGDLRGVREAYLILQPSS